METKSEAQITYSIYGVAVCYGSKSFTITVPVRQAKTS